MGTGCSPPYREHPLPTAYCAEESGRGKFLFCELKLAYFGESEVLNLKFFFIVSSLSGVWVESVANFGFSSKTMNKIHH